MSTSQSFDPLIGRLVDGRYRVRARIARGGMATVYVATDLRLERRVALKVMHGHLSDDAVFQSRFIQEARAAARLADPHVVNVFDQGQDDDMAYLVMEYLPGITLRELLREQRRLSVPQAVTIMDAVLSGLSAAHRAGIIHRDVKPENVLLAEDGRIKIGDFGLARAASANTATGQQLLGTIAYLAPELVTRGTADARSDIYALGIMLYEMLTGEQPYKGEQPMQIAYQHATDSVPRPSVKNPGVPEQLDELVLWATEKDPDERPADAGAMLDRLREIEDQLGLGAQVARTLAVPAVTTPVSRLDSNELTAVLPATSSLAVAPMAQPAAAEADNATRLRTATKRRASRGAWILVLVLLAAALTGGAGWWFGSGPGSLIAVPTVAGGTFAQAQTTLAKLGLKAVQKDEYSTDVAAQTVIGSNPDAGARVAKGKTVTVLVSAGPAPHDIPALAGMSAAEARKKLEEAKVAVGDDVRVFTDAEKGKVVAASITPKGGGAAIDCSKGCTVHEGDSGSLEVSAGKLPDVAGKSVDDATSLLTDKGLQVSGNTVQQNSDTVDNGKVIGIAPRDGGGLWRVNDTVTLIVSKGPQLFPVPDVTGKTRDQAKKILSDAGFTPTYADVWNIFLDSATQVQSQKPKGGAMEPKGTEVQLRIQATG
ncbi:Stk1 family PASTA domain-containing Ser/Thr kinase [Microbacterium candidum]|uniref:non-specific serine/threonine protein kinase n=1 Tax=Microbacterium candidum TaxID=3041922 RepID=A0ABT7N414_9MICO|nr:Stk1 family PASTA domain-containing Ser/Thr kinase [Microbacterium sp. ASV49]MDL9981403.1 Stk1 family PASTA domain-containing Ser/Thr kinase [Microbacterium sp. ASV49]